ncbi:MAG: hypothetical protein R3F60_08595 [bacterium]
MKRALLALALVGCGALRTDRATLRGDCPTSSAHIFAQLLAVGPMTPGPELECVLVRLRAGDAGTRHQALAARVATLLADLQPPGEGREQLAAEGLFYAEQALRARPDDGAAHYQAALGLGMLVEDHPTQALRELDRLRTHLERAVALRPGEDDGGPLRVLGLLYLRAPGWPQGPGDPDQALALLTRAVAEFPGHPDNHLALAEARWTVDEDADAARAGLAAAEAALAAAPPGLAAGP